MGLVSRNATRCPVDSPRWANFNIPVPGRGWYELMNLHDAGAIFVSTPCQRAYADLARSMRVKVGQCWSLW